jgi:hypothetical protein
MRREASLALSTSFPHNGYGGGIANYNGTVDLTNVAPGVTGLGSFGGPTQTTAPIPSSPAIHKGIRVNYAGTNTPLLKDQRGLPLNSPPDISAFQTENG